MNPSLRSEREELRARIVRSLRTQGFRLDSDHLLPPDPGDKARLRGLHAEAVRHRIECARPRLARHETRLLNFIATGKEIIPERVSPRIVIVHPGSVDELLFRYATLHWSIPVSPGYGRRLRFVVYDDANGKLIGIFGLGDPIFNLGPRDRWIGWDAKQKQARLQCVMNLFVVGAVPPYSQLLCGKLIALLAASTDVGQIFQRKYSGSRAIISRKALDGRLALLMTMSALGRSSLYNRLGYQGQRVFRSLGYTQGSGVFHFSTDLYDDLRQLGLERCEATEAHIRWGNDFRNRRELLRKVLPLLGLSRKILRHGIRRQIFAVPLAHNTTAFLCGEDDCLRSYQRSAGDLFAWFRERWLLPRAARDGAYRRFDPESYRLWRRGDDGRKEDGGCQMDFDSRWN